MVKRSANSKDFSVLNLTKAKGTPESAPFKALKRRVLGNSYTLSLVYCSDALSKQLNRVYRGKNKPTNVLAFPVSKTSGEIFINLKRTKGFAPEFLFIHGLLHLKGLSHGVTMERKEKQLLKIYYGKKHSGRNRHRNVPN